MKPWLWPLFALVLISVSAHAAETGYTFKETELKEQPFLDAKTLHTLAEKSVVEILARQGAWMQIKIPDSRQGWVRMLSVRLGSADQKPRSSLLSALSLSRPRPATTSTVTTGVRGFSEEDLAKAKPNPAEVAKMKTFTATPEQATQFAESSNLKRQSVSFFDDAGKPWKEK